MVQKAEAGSQKSEVRRAKLEHYTNAVFFVPWWLCVRMGF